MKLYVEKIFSKIREAEIVNDPFDHLIIEDLLPDSFFKLLSKQLNEENFLNYSRGNYGNKERYGVDLTDYNAWKLSNKKIKTIFHKDNYKILSRGNGKEIKIFIDFLFKNKEELYSLLCAKLPTERIQDDYFFHIAMNKDSKGYEIKPHTDDKENIFTILFYSPETDINKSCAGLHIGKESIDFVPNRMIIFAPSTPGNKRPPTWHEIKKLPQSMVGTRNSFQLFFYKNN